METKQHATKKKHLQKTKKKKKKKKKHQRVNEEIKREIKEYLKTNDNEDTTIQNLCFKSSS